MTLHVAAALCRLTAKNISASLITGFANESWGLLSIPAAWDTWFGSVNDHLHYFLNTDTLIDKHKQDSSVMFQFFCNCDIC